MTDAARSAKNKTTGTLSTLAHGEAADLLKNEAQAYVGAQAERLMTGTSRKLGAMTGKLNDVAGGGSLGIAKSVVEGGRKLAQGKSPLRTILETGTGAAKEGLMNKVKGLTGSGGKEQQAGASGGKPTVIMEHIDIGVPLRTAYDQWTWFEEFSTFAKGVQNVDRKDDTTSDWKLKVLWSNRSWKGLTTEQIPDDRIGWSSEGAQGTTKGMVSFHELAPNLTRVLLLIEYYPSGFFEKTGNLWRAQGRRARLDLKLFARFITMQEEATDAWRGEIRDGEVVRSHEDVLAEEEDEGPADGPDDEGEPPYDEEGEEGALDTEEDAAAEEEEEPAEDAEDAEDAGEEEEEEAAHRERARGDGAAHRRDRRRAAARGR